ncbi:hypothetical protein FSP39_024665 [Pinctada imbricata]|uniref:B box-type domain-containing protein n=1 Tax=Pinctada imbricata TaxID=66713 RepID=A0AA89C682_PINIB|nr:hypothetical protein FSP39_024665 [Pinctada imbricata]
MATAGEKQYCDLLTPVVCDGCGGEDDVINYCLQCNANICGECKSTHCNTRLTREHIILDRTHPEVVKSRRSKKIFCPQHTVKEYVTYCVRCNQPCCTTCIIEDHKGHEFADLESMISQTESEMDKLVHDFETDMIPLSEKALSKLEEEIISYKEAMDNIKQSARIKIDSLIQQLQKSEEEFINEVDEYGKEDLLSMEKQKNELEKNLQQVKSVTIKGKSAPVDASLLFVKDELTNGCSLMPKEIACPGKLSFSESSFQLPPACDIIGRISNSIEKICLSASMTNHHDKSHGTDVDSTSIDGKILKTLSGIWAGSIIHTQEGHTWICNGNDNSLNLYDENFKLIKEINLGFPCEDMTIYDTDEVLVTHRYRIVKVSTSGSINELCSTASVKVRGICINNRQQIVVGGVFVGLGLLIRRFPWRMQVLAPDGSSVLKVIEKERSSGNQLFTGRIYRVRQTVSGEHVVADGKKVVCLTEKWKVKWTYEFGPRQDVFALCCDRHNNILVGDRDNDEIVILNNDGQRIWAVLTREDGICDPRSLDIDGKDRLWIGQEKNVLVSTYLS